MSLQIGIVGLPNVGKSTLFQALTKKQVDIANYPFATIDPNVGIVAVPEARLETLAKLSHSKKIVPAYIEFIDIAGLVKGAAEGGGLGNQFLSHIKEADIVVEVVRAFDDPNIIHVEGGSNPARDIEILETELMLKDLETTLRSLAALERDAKTGEKRLIASSRSPKATAAPAVGAGRKKAREKWEVATRMAENLKKGLFAKDDGETIRLGEELGLLSAKPVLYCFNVKGGEAPPAPAKENAIQLDIKEELELSSLSEEELRELGATPRLPALIRKCYELLGLLTFFTTGEDESRAWTVTAGAKAPRAGRAIHSDFEEKFIRAAVISYDKFIEAGSWAKAREKGLLRTEGKEYAVEEGDIIEFKI